VREHGSDIPLRQIGALLDDLPRWTPPLATRIALTQGATIYLHCRATDYGDTRLVK